MSILEKKVSLYTVALLLFVGIISVIFFGATVRHALLEPESEVGDFQKALLKIAEFPALVKDVLTLPQKSQQINDGRFAAIDGFKKNDKLTAGVLADDGYLLLSTYDADKEQATVQLIQVNTQKTLHEWVPDIDHLNELNILSEEYSKDIIAASHFRLGHPLPVYGSRLVFTGFETGLYGMNLCGENDMFVDGTFHHSNELDHEGNIWTPSVIYPHSFEQLGNFRDDSITKVSPTGDVLFKKSIAEILVENSYRGLLSVGEKNKDPIHMNDIQPALKNSEFWLKGDLLLSLRNRSTVMLYRPSTNKILWLKTGPWMHQHDMTFVDDHTISVFGNDVMFGKLFDGHNNVYFYDFKTDTISKPYEEIMKEARVRSSTEGRGTPLPDGDLFIEETNNGRILRVSVDEVKWEYVRRIDKKTIALSSWSRYLTPHEAAPMLAQLKGNTCIQ